MMRRSLLSLSALCALAWMGGCNTPSVPIPPPEPELMTFALDAATPAATFTYDASGGSQNAIVYVFNRDRGTGIISLADDSGAVTAESFEGEQGDEIVVSFEKEAILSASTCVFLEEGRSSQNLRCF